MKRWLHLMTALLFARACCPAEASNLKRDEQLVFFPAVAVELPKDHGWELQISGCVFELEKRRVAMPLLRRALGLNRDELTESENAMLESRAGFFLVDNERGKRIVLRLGDHTFKTKKSEANGHFSGMFRLSVTDFHKLVTTNESGAVKLRFTAVLRKGDERQFYGNVAIIRAQGLTVVSDIDDTIKISEVRNRDALLRNTFVNSFKAVDGMAELFTKWSAAPESQFFYVSASPWQLYQPLAEFVQTNGFPPGIFLLKDFRWKDRTFWNLFADPERYKIQRIESLLKQFPERHFILVGDSGERDPEAYGEIARRFPKQVARILIRDVTDENLDAERYRTAFREVSGAKVTIFKTPAAIEVP
jgi:phosphatidate phosphatase APP1